VTLFRKPRAHGSTRGGSVCSKYRTTLPATHFLKKGNRPRNLC